MINIPRLQSGGLLMRLAALMTVALLPLGMIAVYQTNAVVNEATRLSHASLQARTERAAARQRELLQRAGGATEGLAASILPVLDDPAGCSELMRTFTQGPNPFTFAAFLTPDAGSIARRQERWSGCRRSGCPERRRNRRA